MKTAQQEFHNRLRIMRCIDLHELVEGGLNIGGEEWARFRDNPWRWFVFAADEDADKVWAIIERRAQA